MMYNIPEKISLANLPTRIEYLKKSSELLGTDIYMKRDDESGIEFSGNKVRKLEYAIAEALREGADTLITCGALQSNHCRATAVAAAKLGLNVVLVLVDGDREVAKGNYLLDMILGADIRFISSEDYKNNILSIMEDIKKESEGKGQRAYIIPTGASNAIGMFGYIEAVKEIIKAEKELGLKFDAVVDTVGSTGTFAGLIVGEKIYGANFDVIGFSISDSAENFRDITYNNIEDCCKKYLSEGAQSYIPRALGIEKSDIKIIDKYVGAGYAINSPEDYEFIKEFARREGIFVDPVYTGKALRGLFSEISSASCDVVDFSAYKNILFIHTGGLYGIFPKAKDIV